MGTGIKTFIKSIFTDRDWDGDATKVFGFIIVVIGIIGFFTSLSGWELMMTFGNNDNGNSVRNQSAKKVSLLVLLLFSLHRLSK